MNRRGFVLGAGACVLAGGAAVAADLTLRPAGAAPAGGAPAGGARPVSRRSGRAISGVLDSRFMKAKLGWTISTPARSPLAVVFCLHGYHNDHQMAFEQLHVPQVAAELELPVVVAAVDGGADSYWHRRADGTDAHAMLMREFIPLVRAKVGPLPQALMGWSMGGYGALLAAERASGQFRAVPPARRCGSRQARRLRAPSTARPTSTPTTSSLGWTGSGP